MSSIFNWFEYKSPEQRIRETREYNAKVFPYGDKQKQKVFEILKQLIPDEADDMLMYNYLTIKLHLIDKPNDVEGCYRVVKSTNKKKENVEKYIALAKIDINIDENLNYPENK